ncbi:hypothetical protein Droror1_Dr00002769 [Drosera rotundifolia]
MAAGGERKEKEGNLGLWGDLGQSERMGPSKGEWTGWNTLGQLRGGGGRGEGTAAATERSAAAEQGGWRRHSKVGDGYIDGVRSFATSQQSGRRRKELCGVGVAGGDELWVRSDRGKGRRFGADWREKGKDLTGCIGMNLSGCTVLPFDWDESEAFDRHQSNGRG